MNKPYKASTLIPIGIKTKEEIKSCHKTILGILEKADKITEYINWLIKNRK